MYQKLLLALLALGLPVQGLTAADHGEKELAVPRLVIGIHIDQLQEEYLRWFMEGFSEGGFKTLLKEGRAYTQVAYSLAEKDNAAVTASLATGCPPSQHGIVSGRRFDRKAERLVSILEDPDWLGNYTREKLSPKALKVSTLGDELKTACSEAKVFSIGGAPEGCMLSAGKKADGVFWIDTRDGAWCTSTYYRDMPRWLEFLNMQNSRSSRLDRPWTPKYEASRYQYMPWQEPSPVLFLNLGSASFREKPADYRHSPMANADVCEFAAQLMVNERLGQDEYPDLLNLHLDASFAGTATSQKGAVQLQDLYFRLDEDLGRLLQEVDKHVGLDKTLVFLTGTGEYVWPLAEDEKTESFWPERCATLLNLYLTAVYGESHWVLGQTGSQIWLNRELIRSRGLDYGEVCRKAADFLSEMEGIRSVYTAPDLASGRTRSQQMENSYHKGLSGDLAYLVETGRNLQWESYPQYNRQLRYAQAHTFLVFYGAGITSARLSDEVSIFDLAPTLCRLLYIRPPTACQGKVLDLQRK